MVSQVKNEFDWHFVKLTPKVEDQRAWEPYEAIFSTNEVLHVFRVLWSSFRPDTQIVNFKIDTIFFEKIFYAHWLKQKVSNKP